MDFCVEKHIRRLPLYVFVIGIIFTIFYAASVWNPEQTPRRSLAMFLMIPFYIGCVALLAGIFWVATQLVK